MNFQMMNEQNCLGITANTVALKTQDANAGMMNREVKW